MRCVDPHTQRCGYIRLASVSLHFDPAAINTPLLCGLSSSCCCFTQNGSVPALPRGSLLSIALTPLYLKPTHTHTHTHTQKKSLFGGGLHRCAPTTLFDLGRILVSLRRPQRLSVFPATKPNQKLTFLSGDSTILIPLEYLVMAVKRVCSHALLLFPLLFF